MGTPPSQLLRAAGLAGGGGTRHGGAELSEDGAGLERRGAGDPASRACASGLLRWLSPARSCGFPGSSPPMEAEAADGPPGGVEAALSCFSFNQDCT